MMATVDLDNQLCIKAYEVRYVSTNFHLSTEFVAATLAVAEIPP
jgi:hypothetical protein